jgi:glutaredoxin 2
MATTTTSAASTGATSELPQLYIYDHCPFCARARVMMGLKRVQHNLIFLLNHDEATPIGLVGAKQVPILQLPGQKAMAESMDIVKYIDTNYGDEPILKPSSGREDLKAWINASNETFHHLTHPRAHQTHFAEFALKEARDYYKSKKEKSFGPFEEALHETSHLVEKANQFLIELAPMFHSNRTFNEELSYDDIDLFGRLRGLTIVKGLQWPQKLREFIDYYSKEGDILLFDSLAKM